jgi:hypothetical protein
MGDIEMEQRNTGLLVICMAVLSCMITGVFLLLLVPKRATAQAGGGCFINFGAEGCNTYITQTITQVPDFSGVLVIACVVIVVLGLAFLFVTRNKGTNL